MKPYTRTGDSGETGLFGGKRVRKDSLRIEVYGTIDELNSLLGYAKTYLQNRQASGVVEKIQADLFIVGGDLATPLDTGRRVGKKTVPRVTPEMTKQLEKIADDLAETLPPLDTFILPGGSRPGAILHYCRAVVRRAERNAVALSAEERTNSEIIRYLNRLSSVLFVLARKVNLDQGVGEQPWRYGSDEE
ncbi:MAG: cob(I)yrinic acid a,c-diamide adenosyltransferase [Thaumarchaeota archaeon]|nr:cob(I)yrinic acid a,c-diamide adenosyltransferase [Nitrososphaerota archaeon]